MFLSDYLMSNILNWLPGLCNLHFCEICTQYSSYTRVLKNTPILSGHAMKTSLHNVIFFFGGGGGGGA